MRTLVIASFLLVTSVARAQEPRDLVLDPVGHKDLVVDHQRHATERGPRLWNDDVRAALQAYAAPGIGPQVKRVVFGYLPYWSYTNGAPYVPLRWDMLTHLAWFAAEMNADGSIGNKHGWGGATTKAMVDDAHAHGVDVIVTITNFTGSEISSIVGSSTNRSRAIASCLALMAEHGADGIDIDFEFVPAASKANFTTFMKELKAAVSAAKPNGKDGHVTLAGPSNDWGGAYDYDQLLKYTDGIMMMAYGYHYGGGNPGPAATLHSGSLWGANLSIEWSINDYFKYGCVTTTGSWCPDGMVAANRSKIILGLPWYGHAWRVANTSVPGDALANGTTVFYDDGMVQMAANGRQWEPISQSSYYHRTVSSNLQQVWVDDAESFEARVAYADEMDIGGIGIWALGYEGTGPELWDVIDDVLGAPTVDPEPQPEPVAETSPEPVAETSPEPVAETSPESVAEPVVEASPEPTPEVGPEPTTETPIEPDPTASPDTSNGGPTGIGLEVQRGVSSRSLTGDDGCSAGFEPSWLAIVSGLAWALRSGRGRRLGSRRDA